MMEGGARYSYGSVSLTGIGTLVDSLFAVREAVYNRRVIPLAQLRDMLARDFEGEESFRLFLANRIAKFGQDEPTIRAFSARVFADLARVSSGKANSRGGRYEASLFSFRSFVGFGQKTGATPDGRKAGQHLSAGMSPSLLALGPKSSVTQVLGALDSLDLTLYPVVAVLDLKMPAMRGACPPEFITPVIQRFLDAGGSVLQVNCVDQQTLVEAKAHPERHPDLVVRVSGYSSYFHLLAPAIQEEIIARTVAEHS
jgi:formate C-acetyltransferase